jgi:hypothetical protein
MIPPVNASHATIGVTDLSIEAALCASDRNSQEIAGDPVQVMGLEVVGKVY